MNRRTAALTGTLLALSCTLGACSSSQIADWPEIPAGFTHHDNPATETVIDTLIVGTRVASGEEYRIEEQHLLDPGEADRQQIVASYADQLDGDGWAEANVPSGSIGRSWATDDQRFTVMIVELDGDLVVVTMASVIE